MEFSHSFQCHVAHFKDSRIVYTNTGYFRHKSILRELNPLL